LEKKVFTYSLYGLCLRSQWPVPYSTNGGTGLAEVELFEGPASLFEAVSEEVAGSPNAADWLFRARLGDGSDYLRWSGLFESVLSSDGRRIAARPLAGAIQDIFQTHILGQILSFALLKLGMDPLHSTSVVIDGGAVAFVGDSGFGKSTLGAAFCRLGHPVVTDDLLTTKEESHGIYAYPGRARLKLSPETAKALLPERVNGVPVDPYTAKFSIPLEPQLTARGALPLRAIYVIRRGTAGSQLKKVTIRTLRHRQALLGVVANSCITIVTDPDRLARQFQLAARLVAHIPVKSLSYPRTLSGLPAVVDAIRADLTP
jgi:hypothetical protein